MDKILEKLKSLVESGQLTEEEFEAISKSLLSNESEGKTDEPPAEQAEPEEKPADDSTTNSDPKEGAENKPEDTVPESGNDVPPTEAPTNEGTADNQDTLANSATEADETPTPETTMEQPIATEVQAQLDAFAERIAALEDLVSSLSRHEDSGAGSNDDFGVGAGGDSGSGNASNSIMAAIAKKLGYSER